MDGACEGRPRGHGHRVDDVADPNRQMVGVGVALPQLALGSCAPAGDVPVVVHRAAVQPLGGVIAGAQRHHIVQPRGAQVLPQALVASPARHGLIAADRAGTPPGRRDLLIGTARPLADDDRACGRPTACRSTGSSACCSSGSSTGPAAGPDTGRSAQAAVQQAGQLGPRHGIVGAVAKRALLAADGEAVREHRVDVGLVRAAPGVGELRRLGPLKPEGPHQERRHLAPGHGPVGAVAKRVGLASDRYLQVGQSLDIGHPPLVVAHVREPGLLDRERVLAVDDSHDPHRHRPALRRIVGTELAGPALGAVEHALLLERFDVGLVRVVRAAVDVCVPVLGDCCRRHSHCRNRGNRDRGH